VSELIREKPKYRLALRRSNDGAFEVVADGKIVFTSRVETAASIEYEELLNARTAPIREARAREKGDAMARGVLAAANAAKLKWRRAGKERGKGG
jgi:hypothetical protein